MTFREAGKSDYIDGVYVPAGTIFYIPVRLDMNLLTIDPHSA